MHGLSQHLLQVSNQLVDCQNLLSTGKLFQQAVTSLQLSQVAPGSMGNLHNRLKDELDSENELFTTVTSTRTSY